MAKGNKPISLFVPAVYTEGTNREGKACTFTHLEKKVKIGAGFSITLILPDDTPLVQGDDGTMGAFVKFYVNYPRWYSDRKLGGASADLSASTGSRRRYYASRRSYSRRSR